LRFRLHSCDEWNIRDAADVQLRTMGENSLSLLQGTVSLLILRALQKGPAHGYSITRWIHERTEGAFVMEDAALYQALHRLEARGFIEAEWGTSENNRRARYYALTVIGRRQLRAEVTSWRRYAHAMLRVIDENV
jgi:PadR family transcriptional regulator